MYRPFHVIYHHYWQGCSSRRASRDLRRPSHEQDLLLKASRHQLSNTDRQYLDQHPCGEWYQARNAIRLQFVVSEVGAENGVIENGQIWGIEVGESVSDTEIVVVILRMIQQLFTEAASLE